MSLDTSIRSADVPSIRTIKDWLRIIACGLCMGTADIIPGISGGTIAFIMGFYEELLNSIKSVNGAALSYLCRGQFRLFFHLVNWKFLLGLVTGIVIAMASLAHFVTYVLNHEELRPLLYAMFLGLILAAAVLCGLQLKKWSLYHLGVFLGTAAIAFFLTGATLPQGTSEELFDVMLENRSFDKPLRNYDSPWLKDLPNATVSAMLAKGTLQPSTPIYSHQLKVIGSAENFIKPIPSKTFDSWIILCGAIAISAMILPGISGSYLLTVLGMYAIVIGALADFAGGLTHGIFDFASFMILVNMLIGIVLGAVVFSRFVSWILSSYHDMAIAALTGFMIGALQSVWPFWSYQYALMPLHLEKGPQLEVIAPIMPDWAALDTWVAAGLMIGGAALVFGLHIVAQKRTKDEKDIVL
jgi:putative membrane protein